MPAYHPTKFFCLLCRFLVARNNNVHNATYALQRTLQWRARFKPENIYWDDVKACASGGRLELLSQADSLGRPILLYRLRCVLFSSIKLQETLPSIQ